MLKDDYETLLRRGMPKHYELRYSGGAWCLIQGHIEESDARDLVTMHALRWLYGMKDARLREKYIDDWSTRFGSGQHRCAPDDTIAAVLCATQGLEPKDPLDAFIERHAC